ncbi:hypothetical protein KKG77_01825 [bacterium]|nr:hypothetical protein [bacterium]
MFKQDYITRVESMSIKVVCLKVYGIHTLILEFTSCKFSEAKNRIIIVIILLVFRTAREYQKLLLIFSGKRRAKQGRKTQQVGN